MSQHFHPRWHKWQRYGFPCFHDTTILPAGQGSFLFQWDFHSFFLVLTVSVDNFAKLWWIWIVVTGLNVVGELHSSGVLSCGFFRSAAGLTSCTDCGTLHLKTLLCEATSRLPFLAFSFLRSFAVAMSFLLPHHKRQRRKIRES